jgi:hypothetical protein
MKKAGIFFFVLLIASSAFAQRISRADMSSLKKREDSLKTTSLKIIQGRNGSDRLFADSAFTRIFVRALKTKNSFYYPFDSIIPVSKLYAPDSSFRIFTWQMQINENSIRQHGAIQMRTVDGSLKIFPLIDKSDITQNAFDTIGNNAGWMGAVYYRLIQKKYKEKNYYTLLGFDENNIRSDKKIMDILTFENEQPVFGSNIFVFENSNVYKKSMARFILEYKKEAVTRLTYDPDMDVILFDELVSETGEPNKKWTMIPDGEFEGFKWINGKWVYDKQIFDGPPPQKYIAPKTIRDINGIVDPTKLKGGENEPVPPADLKN